MDLMIQGSGLDCMVYSVYTYEYWVHGVFYLKPNSTHETKTQMRQNKFEDHKGHWAYGLVMCRKMIEFKDNKNSTNLVYWMNALCLLNDL